MQRPLLPEPPMPCVFELRLCMPVPSTGAAAADIYAYPAIEFSFGFYTPAYACSMCIHVPGWVYWRTCRLRSCLLYGLLAFLILICRPSDLRGMLRGSACFGSLHLTLLGHVGPPGGLCVLLVSAVCDYIYTRYSIGRIRLTPKTSK